MAASPGLMSGSASEADDSPNELVGPLAPRVASYPFFESLLIR